MRYAYNVIGERPLNSFNVRAAIAALGCRHEAGARWSVKQDRTQVAIAVVRHLGGNPTEMDSVARVDGLLRDLEEGSDPGAGA